MIAAGRYEAQLTAWGLVESKSDSNPEQYAIEFEIVGDTTEAGQKITWYGTFSDAAMDYTFQKIRAAGLVGEDLTSLTRANENPVPIKVDHEEWQGKTRAKVSFIGGGGLRTMDSNRAAQFAKRMRGALRAFDQQNGTAAAKPANWRPAAAKPGGAPPAADDDIPF